MMVLDRKMGERDIFWSGIRYSVLNNRMMWVQQHEETGWEYAQIVFRYLLNEFTSQGCRGHFCCRLSLSFDVFLFREMERRSVPLFLYLDPNLEGILKYARLNI